MVRVAGQSGEEMVGVEQSPEDWQDLEAASGQGREIRYLSASAFFPAEQNTWLRKVFSSGHLHSSQGSQLCA